MTADHAATNAPPVSVARWCEDVATAGLAEIRRITAGGPRPGPGGEQCWRTVEVIAETCQRIPCQAAGGHGPVADILLRRALRRAWTATPAEGRQWLRRCSDSLGYQAPRQVTRLFRAHPGRR
ncbi:hypothetical protein [Streptomyces genisteinicus]|uniref:Uncharacterized protein n=1 Tax=Streptomyces genisteinicus TaxID=2768068 RepID=A0A7H0HZV5_9ACTN|nr:hypothetical protein [Streptomyces genisteinicus]QNP66071.1 hypothetical protein IAG43_26200 [Streptomyces genisteinicus]